jgi:hypothetical protein
MSAKAQLRVPMIVKPQQNAPLLVKVDDMRFFFVISIKDDLYAWICHIFLKIKYFAKNMSDLLV